jgi:DNA-binding transcriptional regulator YdaS (Cro superfamily)
MKELQTFIEDYGQSELAKKLGCNTAQVYHWSAGIKPVPTKYCLSIESLSNGAVTRQMLCSDWAQYWPELADQASLVHPMGSMGEAV